MSTPELRNAWKTFWMNHKRVAEEWAKRVSQGPDHRPPFPEELRSMTCGAKTRAGTPCKQKGIYENGRCQLHGGLSTGPVTVEGKKKSALNWKKRKIFIKDERTPWVVGENTVYKEISVWTVTKSMKTSRDLRLGAEMGIMGDYKKDTRGSVGTSPNEG